MRGVVLVDGAAIAGVLTAAAGLIAAVGALVAQWRHVKGPKHNPRRTSSGGGAGTIPGP